jgi:hypothetical protein
MKKLTLFLVASYLITPCVQASGSSYLSEQQRGELNRRSSYEAVNSILDPDLVREYNINREELEKAQLDVLAPPKIKRVRKIKIDSRTGSKIHTIHVYPNQITVLTLTDSMGKAWPLSAPPNVASEAYKPNYDENIPGLVTLETTAKFVPSNMVIALRDKIRPLQFQLISDNSVLDSMIEIEIAGRSPLNNIVAQPLFGGLDIPDHSENNLERFFDDPPEDAIKLATIGDSKVDAWQWNGKCYLRTPYQLLDPSNPIALKATVDRKEKIYLLSETPDIAAFIDEQSSQIINVKIQTGQGR